MRDLCWEREIDQRVRGESALVVQCAVRCWWARAAWRHQLQQRLAGQTCQHLSQTDTRLEEASDVQGIAIVEACPELERGGDQAVAAASPPNTFQLPSHSTPLPDGTTSVLPAKDPAKSNAKSPQVHEGPRKREALAEGLAGLPRFKEATAEAEGAQGSGDAGAEGLGRDMECVQVTPAAERDETPLALDSGAGEARTQEGCTAPGAATWPSLEPLPQGTDGPQAAKGVPCSVNTSQVSLASAPPPPSPGTCATEPVGKGSELAEDELEAMRKKREALAERMAALQRFKALQQGSGGPGGGS